MLLNERVRWEMCGFIELVLGNDAFLFQPFHKLVNKYRPGSWFTVRGCKVILGALAYLCYRNSGALGLLTQYWKSPKVAAKCLLRCLFCEVPADLPVSERDPQIENQILTRNWHHWGRSWNLEEKIISHSPIATSFSAKQVQKVSSDGLKITRPTYGVPSSLWRLWRRQRAKNRIP